MADTVDTGLTGVTELRIHGVSGTPPEDMLEHPMPVLVAGDAVSGFYRRLWPEGDAGKHEAPLRREAYSWAGLTSGGASRALWLLLLPFMLVNIGFWMVPTKTERKRVRRVGEAAQRLFALTMTVSMVVAFSVVFVDVVGWQCSRSAGGCIARHGFLRFLGRRSFDQPGYRLAAMALVPLAIVLLLWRLGHHTWSRYESTAMPGLRSPDRLTQARSVQLESRKIWNGRESVARMRAAHVSAATATIGALVISPLLRETTMSSSLRLLLHVLLIVQLLALAIAAVVSLTHATAKRDEPPTSDVAAADMTRSRTLGEWAFAVAPWICLALLLVSLVAVGSGRIGLDRAVDAAHPSALPLLHGAIVAIFLVQGTLIAVIAVTTAMLASAAKEGVAANREDLPPARALYGVGGAVLPFFGWLLAGGFAAGFTVRLADYLGRPVRLGDQPAYKPGPDAVVVPPAYYWAAVGFAVILAVLVAYLVPWWLIRTRQGRRDLQASLVEAYPDVAGLAKGAAGAEDTDRTNRILKTWTLAGLTDRAGEVLFAIAVLSAVVAIAGTLGFGFVHAGPPAAMSWLTTLGTWLIGAFAVGLVGLGRMAYKTPKLRRTVGILWDVGSFWPRATHPLAPPCYTERVLPDLILRMDSLSVGTADRVLLSAHSQGTILAAATILQLDDEVRSKTALITYGSPLRRLYGAFFPTFFGTPSLARVGEVLSHEGASRSAWPWVNLHRPSDPIGGPVFRRYPLGLTTPPTDVDEPFVDPVFAKAAGDPVYPKTHGHSDYWLDPGFAAAVDRLVFLRRKG